MTEIKPFEFPATGQQVRSVLIDGEPWFVAADVCAVLAIRNNRDALASLDEDEKGVATTDTPGGAQQVSIVNEPGLYSLILRSRKPVYVRLSWVYLIQRRIERQRNAIQQSIGGA